MSATILSSGNEVMNTEQMAAKLYEIRDTARRLLGDKYAPHMAELGDLLKRTAAKQGCSELVVAQQIAARDNSTNCGVIAILAAAVELIAPSANTEAAE